MISSPESPLRLAALACAVTAFVALASGCAAARERSTDSFFGLITPYRIDIVQGNAITSEQVALVKPGMTRSQVRDILGSPMLTDLFHANRWDYIFSIRRQGTEPQRRSVVAHFEGDRLVRLDAPESLPSENEFVAAIVPVQRSGAQRPLELTEEQRKALPVPVKKDLPPPEVTGAVRAYPPLETR
ncbi:MAG TPA: outer membrane protein assembly factor BamE [Rubrivivax sp.]